MKLFFGLFSLILIQLSFTDAFAQGIEMNPYKIYAEQVRSLSRSRGMPQMSLDSILKIYGDINIRSDEDFAKFLTKIYPEDKSNGFLFYFFNDDSLKVVFFTPGKIIERKVVHIKRQELIDLAADINIKIGLSTAATNRAPRLRGVSITNHAKPSKLPLDSLLSKATKLLVPKLFDSVYKHITIIPALNIGTFPFHILKPYGDDTFLIERCSFMVAPGIVDLFGKRIRYLQQFGGVEAELPEKFSNLSKDWRAGFTLDRPLLVGNPKYPTDSAYFFPDLPGAEKEIKEAASFSADPTLLLGEQATKANVLKYLNISDLAYFATHGVANETDPMNKSFIVLSGESPYLTAKEIMNYGNRKQFPEMVILSACQTGLGRPTDAGIAGLARSFLFAGSYNVIMSLWNVDDEATAYLMSRFIFHLKTKCKFMPSDQLRLAILDARKQFPKITQWAGFSAFGVDLGD